MTVRIGKIQFDDWVSLELPGGWSDTFIFRAVLTDGLPPADYARIIRSLIRPMLKLRMSASLWVQCVKPPTKRSRIAGESIGGGRWFAQEMRQTLRGLPVPVAVTSDSVQPQIQDFSFFPWVDYEPLPGPLSAEPYLKGKDLGSSAVSCLQVLARADCAYTAEIASLANLSRTTARKVLRSLEKNGYLQLIQEGKYPFWKIRRTGLLIALRSWGLPPDTLFRGAKNAVGLPAKSESPQARPDALCWGRLDGHETLFWLEVESGNTSIERLRRNTVRRVNRALVYARGFALKVVFALLGPPWVRREVVVVFQDLPNDVAVVMEDWRAFGELPVPVWGKVS